MKQFHFCWVLVLSLLNVAALAQDEPTLTEPKMMPGMLIVKFNDPTDALANRFANAQQKEQRTFSGSPALAEVLQTPGVYCFERALGGNSPLAQQVFCVRFDPDQVSIDALKAQLQTLPSVAYVEENAMLQGNQERPDRPNRPDRPDRPSRPDRPGRPAEVATTNDPLLDEQYNVQITRALEAQALLTGDGTATVAVVDDAVLTTHEDLADNIFINEGEMGLDSAGTDKASNGVDDDGNGYVDDVQGYDVADDDGDPTPPDNIPFREIPGGLPSDQPAFYHGTHVAGVAAGVTDNNTGIASVSANRVKIIPVKATPDTVATLTYTGLNIARGLVYAIDMQADVVNMSFGSFFAFTSRFYRDIIAFGEDAGVLFVSSAGNNPTSDRGYPAAFDEVIAVAGTAAEDAAYANTSFGDWVDVAAPAVDILSTSVAVGDSTVTNVYREETGTSFACPLVAGLVALLKTQDPSLTPEQLRQIIRETADPVDNIIPRLAGQLGGGRVNVYNAVARVVGGQPRPVADFVATATTVYTEQAVKLVDRSLGTGLRYQWRFRGGSPATSSEASPTVSYARSGRYPVVLRVTNAGGTDVITKEAFITVQPTPEVDVVGLPFEGEVSARSFPNTSFFFANRLVYPEDRLLTSVKASFFELPESEEDPRARDLTLKVWRVKGKSADEVHEQIVNLDSVEASGIADVPSFNDIVLTRPVEITAADTFLVGFQLSASQFGIHRYASEDGNGFINLFDAAAAEGELVPFSWLIFPTLVASDLLPTDVPSFGGRICAEESLLLDATGLDDQFNYRWIVENLSPVSQLGQERFIPVAGELDTLSLPLSQRGYEVSLQLSGVESEVVRLDTTFRTSVSASLQDTVITVACDRDTEAFFKASQTTVTAGEQITYEVQQNSDATDFAWSFPGGEPSTSDAPRVTVTYPTPGVYGVGLVTSNSGGEPDTLSLDDYIVVTDDSCADFTVVGLPLPSADVFGSSRQGFARQSADSLQAFGNLFQVDPAQQIYGMRMLLIDRIEADRPNDAFVTFYAWDNDGEEGTPGTVLAQTRYSYREIQDLITPPSESAFILGRRNIEERAVDVDFDSPVPIPADSTFILGYEVNYGGPGNDQRFGVVYTYPGDSPEEDAFVRFPSSNWSSYEDATDGFLEIRLGIGALVGNLQSINQPEVALNVSPGPYTLGEPIQLAATDTSGRAVAYRWEVSITDVFGDIATSGGERITLSEDDLITRSGENSVTFLPENSSPSDTAIYLVTLSAINECGVEDRASETFTFAKEDEPDDPDIPVLPVRPDIFLINASTGEVLLDFDGREDDLENLIYLEDPRYQGVPLSIRAEVDSDTVGSVGFLISEIYDTIDLRAFDNTAPYELVGDETGQLAEWTPAATDYFISAITYSSPDGFNGERERITDERVRLLVYDSAMIPLEIIPLCSEDTAEVRWEIENFNNTDVSFEYQYEGLGEDEWLFSRGVRSVASTTRRIITTPTTASFRIRWRNELGEFEFAEATANNEACLPEESARRTDAAGKESSEVDETRIRVYPNPTTATVTVDGLGAGKQPVSVQVRDVLGRRYDPPIRRASGKWQLDLRSLPTGWYHVSVQSPRGTTLHRVLKE